MYLSPLRGDCHVDSLKTKTKKIISSLQSSVSSIRQKLNELHTENLLGGSSHLKNSEKSVSGCRVLSYLRSKAEWA